MAGILAWEIEFYISVFLEHDFQQCLKRLMRIQMWPGLIVLLYLLKIHQTIYNNRDISQHLLLL